jgi:rhodanese-related sulfurtransferase
LIGVFKPINPAKDSDKMKIRYFLLVVLLFGLVACGAGEETADSTNTDIDISTLAPNIDVQTAHAVQDHENVFLLDVREQWEYDEGHIPNITLIPMGEVANRLSEIPKDQEVIVTCRSGNRSSQITDFLRQQGFDNVHNMDGGIVAWEAAGYEVEN